MPTNPLDPEEAQRMYETFGCYDFGLFAKRFHVDVMVWIGLIDATCPAARIQASMNNPRGEVIIIYRPRMPHLIPEKLH